MSREHPALAAAHGSWSAVRRKAKQEWLALMAEDVVIEDPIGVSALDPSGKGQRGKEAVSAFWDQNIGPNTVEIEPSFSSVAGVESAHLLTLTTTFANGVKVRVKGIFTYRVTDEGKIASMRGFWNSDDIQMEQPTQATSDPN